MSGRGDARGPTSCSTSCPRTSTTTSTPSPRSSGWRPGPQHRAHGRVHGSQRRTIVAAPARLLRLPARRARPEPAGHPRRARRAARDDTVIAYTSDHGTPAQPLALSEAAGVYEEVPGVPLIMKVPGDPGRHRNRRPRHPRDLATTVCSAASTSTTHPHRGGRPSPALADPRPPRTMSSPRTPPSPT